MINVTFGKGIKKILAYFDKKIILAYTKKLTNQGFLLNVKANIWNLFASVLKTSMYIINIVS